MRSSAGSARSSSPARRRPPWAAPRPAPSWPRRPASPPPPRSRAWSRWPRPRWPGSASPKPPSRSVMTLLLWHYRLVASTDLDRLARTAYEAHRGAQSGSLPPWEDTSDQEKKAWRAAVSALTGSAESTLTEAPAAHSIVVQAGDQVRTFHTEFTARRPAGQPGRQRRARLQPPRPVPAGPRLLVRPGPRLDQRHLAQQPPHVRGPAAEEGRQDQDRPHHRGRGLRHLTRRPSKAPQKQ